jgi:hypothetical protein
MDSIRWWISALIVAFLLGKVSPMDGISLADVCFPNREVAKRDVGIRVLGDRLLGVRFAVRTGILFRASKIVRNKLPLQVSCR